MAEAVRQDTAAFLHRLNDHVAAHRATEPTDAQVFGEDRGFKNIRIVNGSAYDTVERVWTTPNGFPINYLGVDLCIYDYTGIGPTITIPEKLDGFDVKAVKFGSGALPASISTIDATNARALRVFFFNYTGVTDTDLDGLNNVNRVNVDCKNPNINFVQKLPQAFRGAC